MHGESGWFFSDRLGNRFDPSTRVECHDFNHGFSYARIWKFLLRYDIMLLDDVHLVMRDWHHGYVFNNMRHFEQHTNVHFGKVCRHPR